MLDLQNATEIYEKLKAHYAGRYEVGLFHGQLTSVDIVLDHCMCPDQQIYLPTG